LFTAYDAVISPGLIQVSGAFVAAVVTWTVQWRRIFGPKRDGETGVWRKLHNEEVSDFYSSPK
jgi:hypothetical protein